MAPILLLADFHQNGDFRKILEFVGRISHGKDVGVVLWSRRILLRTPGVTLDMTDF